MDGELWTVLYQWIEQVDKAHAQDPRKRHRDAAVVATLEYAVLHDRPVCGACAAGNGAGVGGGARPADLPSQPTVSRRLNHDPGVRAFREELACALGGSSCLAAMLLVGLIDGKALPVPRHSTDGRRRLRAGHRGGAEGLPPAGPVARRGGGAAVGGPPHERRRIS